MQDTDPATGDEQVEQALDELMRATDAFVVSWAAAVRRFAVEPVALRRFRELHEAGLAAANRARTTFVPEFTPLADAHPLWDRALDG